jgi:hypothetical protein
MYVAEPPTHACTGALVVACLTGFGGTLTSTHMYDSPSSIPHHTKCDMAVAALREENSFHPQAPTQEEKTKHAFVDGIDFQGKTQDLPCPNPGLRLQSWLLCGRTAERVTCLSPSEGAPILSPTNLYRSVDPGQPHQDHPL